jgi:hypothetical protein
MQNYRFIVEVEVDVTGADSESQARKLAFGAMASQSTSKGRPSSGPKVAITGVKIGTDQSTYTTYTTGKAYPKLVSSVSTGKNAGDPDVME